MPSEMVERVEKALRDAENPHEAMWNDFEAMARAAIAAMREPTEKMVGAGTDEASNHDMLQTDAIPEVYRAMIDAALDEKANSGD